MKYLFGPVNSRRLGISLGIDIIPFKTCTLNCVYCECGATTDLTNKIKEYAPAEDIIKELDEFLTKKPELDSITFAGSGEPTLNSGIERIIDFIKSKYPVYHVTVLTNSTLLHKKEVRKSILKADTIIPSLDAVSRDAFKKICRPSKEITVDNLIEGLTALSKEFPGILLLEIFIVPGINDNDIELKKIKEVCLKINPDKIQLNILDRPGAESWVKPASISSLNYIKEYLEPLDVEVVGNYDDTLRYLNNDIKNCDDIIITTIQRRPSTLNDLSNTLGIPEPELSESIKKLIEDNIIEMVKTPRGDFLKLKR